jgi:hypothetical protein
MKLATAAAELIAELDEALIMDAANNRVFELRDMDADTRTRVGISKLLQDNESDAELCNWMRGANLGAKTGIAQGKMILKRVE